MKNQDHVALAGL